MARQDGFEGLKAFLPPPSRRALVLIDPSYEIKSDYQKVSACIQDSLKRFATGTYAVWYPIIPRPEAHELPRRLKTLANQAGKPWLHATLAIGQAEERNVPGEPERGQGLTASGMFVINPPHTLKPALQLPRCRSCCRCWAAGAARARRWKPAASLDVGLTHAWIRSSGSHIKLALVHSH